MKSKTPYNKKRKRIGRGEASGHGKTSTKGHKGQKARSGFTMRPMFEGGQTTLIQRIPKRGFNRPHHKEYTILNLDQLEQFKVSEVTPDWLIKNKIVKSLGDGLKILGRGKLTQKVKVQAHKFSAQAQEAIKKAGGEAILIGKK